MKAYKISLLIFSVIGLLALCCAFMPSDGIVVTEDFTLRFPTIQSVLYGEEEISGELVTMEPDETPEQMMERRLNELKQAKQDEYDEYFRTNPARIEFPGDDPTMFDKFFATLEGAETKPVRVMHYGDSQIEIDRITNIFREGLQQKFGGIGVGLVPVVQTVQTVTIAQTCNAEPIRYLAYNGAMKNKACGYGPMAMQTIINSPVTCTFTGRGGGRPTLAKKFSQVKVLVTNVRGSFTVNIGGQSKTVEDTASVQRTHVLSFTLPAPQRSVTLTMKGRGAVQGIMLDGKNGVQVDNIPMRGCAGTIFTDIRRDYLADYFDNNNVSLIIMQYGGNVMPYLKTEKQITGYCSRIAAQVRYIKRLAPNAEVLFIGPSDMTTRVEGSLRTYPYLPSVVNAIRNAVHENGAAYWDMYSVMGGYNSMIQWAKTGLAGTDYVHFTPKGADKIGDMLFKTLMLYYDYYRFRTHPEEMVPDTLDGAQEVEPQLAENYSEEEL